MVACSLELIDFFIHKVTDICQPMSGSTPSCFLFIEHTFSQSQKKKNLYLKFSQPCKALLWTEHLGKASAVIEGAKVSQSRQDLQEVLALAEQLVPLHYDAEINAQQARHATTLSVVHRGASL